MASAFVELSSAYSTCACEHPPTEDGAAAQTADWQFYPRETPLAALVEVQVARTPDAVAVVLGEQSLTYEELNRQANRLAQELRRRGAAPGALVGLYVHRSAEMMIALLAIAKSGAGYLPLDPYFPAERLAYMLEHSRSRVMITTRDLQNELPNFDGSVVLLDDSGWEANSPENAPIGGCAEDAAYVLYTSGSTGRPKGVEVPRSALINLLWSVRRWFDFTAADRLLGVTTISFDIAGCDLWLPLITGAQLVIATREQAADGEALMRLIDQHKITFLQATPVTFQLLIGAGWEGSQHLKGTSSGEALPRELVPQLHSRTARFWNMYGPTETTIWSTGYEITRRDCPVLIGVPVANTLCYLLDEKLQPVAEGEIGELFLGGDGLANGYLHQPELTAEKFLPDPFCGQADARMYRTGDLARRLPDGNIECLGRTDHQVKIRGYRIELGEIESRLKEMPEVAHAVVVGLDDAHGGKRLIAYVVMRSGNELDRAALHSHLSSHLPAYMLPAAYVPLEALPISPNGKIDRKNLPTPAASDECRHETEYVAPETELEAAVLALWEQVFAQPRLGVENNFFDLGGHSLLAVRLLSLLRSELRVSLGLKTLFTKPTVRLLTQAIEEQRGDASAASDAAMSTIRRSSEPPVLSTLQERMWFLQELVPESSAYNVPYAIRLNGAVREDYLHEAFRLTMAQHELLRTRIVSGNGQPTPMVSDVLPEMSLVQVSSEAELEARVIEQAQRPLALDREAMIRAVLFRLNERTHVMSWILHHSAVDDLAVGVLLREFEQAYAGLMERGTFAFPAPPALQYSDFAAWQRGWQTDAWLKDELGFWKQFLGDTPTTLELPTDFARPAMQAFRGRTAFFTMPPAIEERVREFARQEKSTVFTVMLAAFELMIARYSGQQEFILGFPVAGREHPQLEGLCGFLANTVVIPCAVDEMKSFGEFARSVQQTTLDALAHPDVPFEKLVSELRLERSPARAPLVEVFFAYQQSPRLDLSAHGIETRALNVDIAGSKLDLSFYVEDRGTHLELLVEYSTDLFRAETVERMTEQFFTLLDRLIERPAQAMTEASMLSPAEEYDVLYACNATERALTANVTVVSLFEAQAERVPGSVALIFEDRSLTYRELNERCNRLAHELIARGVRAGVAVGIHMQRSETMLAALLAVLKTGAMYIPLDPSFPETRLGWTARQSGMQYILTETELEEASHRIADGTPVNVLNVMRRTAFSYATTNPDVQIEPESVAYVLYTSGSTGEPKGVEITHSNFTSFLEAAPRDLEIHGSDRVLALTTISFDISCLELFLPLTLGGSVVLASREDALQPERLASLVERHQVTVMQATPVTFQALLDNHWQGDPRLKALCGGEAMPPTLAAILRPRVRTLWNVYGPTETTIWSTAECVKEAGAFVSIGKPLANERVYVLDAFHKPQPAGVAGEIWIGGAGVARGYRGRPDLTAERFVPDPFSPDPQARMYRTGDRGRRLADGRLECLGRVDSQIKLHGYRIELGDIEAHLLSHEAVNEAAVMVRDDRTGAKVLAAYVVVTPGFAPDIADLRAHLRKNLPSYMTPSSITVLDAMPLTANRKVNRKALPAPAAETTIHGGLRRAPFGRIQHGVHNAFCRVLGLKEVDIEANFFDLGGDSLKCGRVLTIIRRELNVQLPMRVMYEAQSVRAVAHAVEQRSVSTSAEGDWPTLVPIQPSGSRTPLFCVSRPNVNAMGYAMLARHLGNDQPVYGLQKQLEEDPSLDFTAEQYREVARESIAAMRTVQPHGPYNLVGFCQGAYIAFAMVRELEAQGESLSFFGVLDTWTEENTRVRWLFRLARGIHMLKLLTPRRIGRKVRNTVAHAHKPTRTTSICAAKPSVNQVRWDAYWPGEDFVPETCSSNVTVFRVKRQSFFRVKDASLGWQERTAARVESETVPGRHLTLLRDPHVSVLASRIAARLRSGREEMAKIS